MQRLLYYPMVNPPPLIVWQGLLYWDGIASIAPSEGDYFRPLLRELRDSPMYSPLDANSLKLWDPQRYDTMLRELEAIIAEIPGKDLAPEPGPLRRRNRLYYGKLPRSLEGDLLAIGAAEPNDDAMRVNPRLLVPVLAVVAKHLAEAYTDESVSYFLHTNRRHSHRIAFGPLTRIGSSRSCWQVQVGAVLPVPARDTPLSQVLKFRDDYQDERLRLRIALHRLFKDLQDIDDPEFLLEAMRQEINQAVRDLETALRGRKIVWVKRGLWALVGVGSAAASVRVGAGVSFLPLAVSGLSINLATSVTRTHVSGEFAYVHQLRKTFPSADVEGARAERG